MSEPEVDPGHLLPVDDWLAVVESAESDVETLDFSDLRVGVPPDSPLVTYSYLASNYGGSQDPNIGVLHDVESPLKAGYARSLIGPNWFGGPAKTSTHYIVDPVDICQGVPEGRIAWHCGGGNPRSIAVEQAGYARFSRADWTTPDGLKQKTNVARLMADINKRRPAIKLRWLSDGELRTAFNSGGPGGWATHDQMRRVIGGTTHYDPMNAPNAGSAYPLSELMNEAIAIRGGVVIPPDPKPPVTEEDLFMFKVLRCNGVDHAYNDIDAFVIENPDHYHFLRSCGKITVDHGQAPECAQNLIDFVYAEAAKARARLFGHQLTSLVNGNQYSISDMLQFIDLNAHNAAQTVPKA